jgi:hypothetical protein
MGKFDQFNEVNFDDLRNKIKEEQKQKEAASKGKDKSFIFKPILDKKAAQVKYVVRILPNVHQPENKYPWVEASAHMFRRADGKFIYTLCPFTYHGKDAKCPICEKSKAYFATQDAADEKRALDLWRKPRSFINVLVVEDPRSGEESQEGKVVIWEIGKKLQQKLSIAFNDKKINFWHPLKGHNFNLIITRQGEYDNYDNCDFEFTATPIAGTDKAMDKIFDSIHNIQEKMIGAEPHSYDKLTQILNGVAPERSNESSVGGAPKTPAEPKVEAAVESTKPVKAAKATTGTAPASKPVAPPEDEEFDFNFDDNK